MMRRQLISCMIPFDGFIHNLLIKLTSVYAMKLHVRLFGSTQGDVSYVWAERLNVCRMASIAALEAVAAAVGTENVRYT